MVTRKQPFELDPQAKGLNGKRVLVIRSPYYEDIAARLTAGAITVLELYGVDYDIVDVPGALEIPQALAIAVAEGRFGATGFSGAIALGCVVRGETTHYEIVSENANHWLMDIAIRNAIPLGNAVLTVETMEQAVARAEGEGGGKGGEAAVACLTLMGLPASFGDDRS